MSGKATQRTRTGTGKLGPVDELFVELCRPGWPGPARLAPEGAAVSA